MGEGFDCQFRRQLPCALLADLEAKTTEPAGACGKDKKPLFLIDADHWITD
jgi:hypothetical protein